MADGEHAAVHGVQATGRDAPVDRAVVQAGDPELRS
jgi:hypothetical protein